MVIRVLSFQSCPCISRTSPLRRRLASSRPLGASRSLKNTMALSTAEKNRRKRERKKKEKEERRKEDDDVRNQSPEDKKEEDEIEIEIEYVVEPIRASESFATKPPPSNDPSLPEGLPPMNGEIEQPGQEVEDIGAVLRRFHQRSAVATVVTDDERKGNDEGAKASGQDSDDEGEDDDDRKPMSKRKLRELIRPDVAALKRRVKRPDLVEAHDITAADPDFLIHLKAIPGTVPVPRHWGRKRKYLQGKRGFEKPPFQLPDFIVKTGITEIRDTVAEDEAKQSAKQKNRSRVNPKMGSMDVDYKTLYEAFFRFQTKPKGMTKFGDLYYEGKEMETSTNVKPGGPLSKALRAALGMTSDSSPPPWLFNMQRYGPPPSYPHLSIPGLNAPLPNDQCQYGFHTGGWGKPPMDQFGRPLCGGNPFDPPGSGKRDEDVKTGLVTSDGKTLAKTPWGMPVGQFALEEDDDESSEEDSQSGEESSVDAMAESDEEHEQTTDGMESVLPPPTTATSTVPSNLRKTAGDETPINAQPKLLYQVLEQTSNNEQGGVFKSDVKYMVPGATAAAVPDGAESVLSKAVAPNETTKRKMKTDDDDESNMDRNFKF